MPVLRNGDLARREPDGDPPIKVEDVRVGDLVEVLLHPAGPGTEQYRQQHGHRVDLTVLRINNVTSTFDGEFYIEDLEALFQWLTLMDGNNSGEQIRERREIPDIPLYCIEKLVERPFEFSVTTENIHPRGPLASVESDGVIIFRHHKPLSTSKHLTHLDLRILTQGGTCIDLTRVDADKIIHVCQAAQRAAGRPVTRGPADAQWKEAD